MAIDWMNDWLADNAVAVVEAMVDVATPRDNRSISVVEERTLISSERVEID